MWSHHHDYLDHEDLFLQFFCVFLPPLLNIFCFCYVHTIFVLYLAHFCMKCSHDISNFLEEISSLSHSSISLHWSLRKAFLFPLAILWNSAFKWIYLSFCHLLFASLLFRALYEDSDSVLLFCISFSWRWSWSLPSVQCHEPASIVLQALCLSDLIPWIGLSFPLYNRKELDLGHTWMV